MHANRLIVLPSSINNVRLILFPNKGQTCGVYLFTVLRKAKLYIAATGRIRFKQFSFEVGISYE